MPSLPLPVSNSKRAEVPGDDKGGEERGGSMASPSAAYAKSREWNGCGVIVVKIVMVVVVVVMK